MLVKYDDAVIFSFARAYSFHQAQNHVDKMNLKSVQIWSFTAQPFNWHHRENEVSYCATTPDTCDVIWPFGIAGNGKGDTVCG